MGGREIGGSRQGGAVGWFTLSFQMKSPEGSLLIEHDSNPNLPWGDGFQAPNGNAVDITMTRDATGPNWSSSMNMGSSKIKDTFPIAYKNFNQV